MAEEKQFDGLYNAPRPQTSGAGRGKPFTGGRPCSKLGIAGEGIQMSNVANKFVQTVIYRPSVKKKCKN